MQSGVEKVTRGRNTGVKSCSDNAAIVYILCGLVTALSRVFPFSNNVFVINDSACPIIAASGRELSSMSCKIDAHRR
jgi:hypothetical protein